MTGARLRNTKDDLEGALADFSKAIELKPDFVEAYSGRGWIHRKRNGFNKVYLIYKQNRSRTRSKPGCQLSIRGEIRYAKGDFADALTSFSRAIELNPNYAIAYNNRGLIKKKSNDLEGALADYNKAIELDPELASAYKNRAGVKLAKGDSAGARRL